MDEPHPLREWMGDDCAKFAERLLASRHDNEDEVSDDIKRLLDVAGHDYKPQANQNDLVLLGARVVIEVKGEGRASNPDAPGTGSQGRESAYEQLCRYVNKRRKEDEQKGLDFEHYGGWRGVLSDGHYWHMWEWPPDPGSFEKPSYRKVHYKEGQGSELAVWMGRVCERYRGLAPIPDSFHEKLFASHLKRLRELRSKILRSNDEHAKTVLSTQYKLWEDMLSGADMRPPGGQSGTLFESHTFLVVVARSVAHALAGNTESLPAKDEAVAGLLAGDGFVSWVLQHPAGKEWVGAVFMTASEFDWRAISRDVFREMYETVIDVDLRRYFGEYYTPDWLAEMVVEEVLDDDWCNDSINKIMAAGGPVEGVGVLDPTCGSGTFLYHAARHILKHQLLAGPDISDVKKADVVAHLVNGIDIHPIAVEIAKATLLRAMPAEPSQGIKSLRIWQGDALGQITSTLTQADDTKLTFRSPEDRVFILPIEFLKVGQQVQQNLTTFVAIAVKAVENKSNETLPTWLLAGLSDQASEQVQEAFIELVKVVENEGNGVWAWFMSNQADPHLLSLTKIDRIVANPPWVTMSKVQEPQRKESLEALISQENLYSSGSVGNRGAFDIAALFLRLCPTRYLAKQTGDSLIGRTGWVLNAGSLRGGNWEAYNRQRPPTKTVDLSSVKEAPFDGAAACVHYFGNQITASSYTMSINNNRGRIKRSDRWDAVKEITKVEVLPVLPPPAPSDYVTQKSIRSWACDFRAGGRINPANFVVCDMILSDDGKKATFSTLLSSRAKQPWKEYRSLEGSVPSRWIHDIVLADNFYPFAISKHLSQCILPTDEQGSILVEQEAENSDYWQRVSDYYNRHRGSGRATPSTLLEYLNMQNNLLTLHSQLEKMDVSKEKLAVVYYNASGQHIRAARSTIPLLCSDKLYYAVLPVGEAGYLVSIINSDILAVRLRSTCRSDRDFHTYFWREIPIPKFDSTQTEHLELSRLCTKAETVSQSVRQTVSQSDRQSVSQSVRQTVSQSDSHI